MPQPLHFRGILLPGKRKTFKISLQYSLTVSRRYLGLGGMARGWLMTLLRHTSLPEFAELQPVCFPFRVHHMQLTADLSNYRDMVAPI